MIILCISLVAQFKQQPAFAEELTLNRTSKVSTEIRGINNKTGLGILFGWRYVAYESDIFFVGGTGFTGQLSKTPGSFSYGGMLAGFSFRLGNMEIETSLTAGGAGGFVSTKEVNAVTNDNVDTAGGIMLEPGLSFSFHTGKAVRTAINAGYIWIPSSKKFTSIAAGIRFDFLLH